MDSTTLIMLETIKAYIWHRTGREVDIIPPRSHREMMILNHMNSHALKWFQENGSIVIVTNK